MSSETINWLVIALSYSASFTWERETASVTLSMKSSRPIFMNLMLVGRVRWPDPEYQSSGVPHLVTPSKRRWAVRKGQAAT